MKNKKSDRTSAFAETALLLVLLQGGRIGLEKLISPYLPDTRFAARMTTCCVMLLLAAATVVYAALRKTPLSVFPARFGWGYIAYTCIAAALLVSSPSNYTGGIEPVMLALYGCVVTPVFEELVFRGYIWNRLNKVLSKEPYTYLWSVLLFTLWHLGYMLPQLASGDFVPVIWKLAAGAGYGAVLGFIRLKTHNCYSTMLAHGVLNMFMI